MSRIGNKPVSIIDGVKVSVAGGAISVEGPKGKLSYTHRPEVVVAVDEGVVKVSRGANDKNSRASQLLRARGPKSLVCDWVALGSPRLGRFERQIGFDSETDCGVMRGGYEEIGGLASARSSSRRFAQDVP